MGTCENIMGERTFSGYVSEVEWYYVWQVFARSLCILLPGLSTVVCQTPRLPSCMGYCFTRETWITPVHYPLSSSLFQPYSSTSRTPSLHGLWPPVRSLYTILPDCPLFYFCLCSLNLVILRSEPFHELTRNSTNLTFNVDPWKLFLLNRKSES